MRIGRTPSFTIHSSPIDAGTCRCILSDILSDSLSMPRSARTPLSLLIRSTPPQSTQPVSHFECHLPCIDFMPAADTLHLGDATPTSHSPLLPEWPHGCLRYLCRCTAVYYPGFGPMSETSPPCRVCRVGRAGCVCRLCRADLFIKHSLIHTPLLVSTGHFRQSRRRSDRVRVGRYAQGG